MGRFAYQPLSEEFVKTSQSGQIIMNTLNGHISANRNNIIISKTKEIEDKITDINELKYDVDEQSDVISNLLEDFVKFIEGSFLTAEEAQRTTYIFDKKLLVRAVYMSDLDKAMRKKLARIEETINEFVRANNLQLARMDTLEEESTIALTSIGDMAYVEAQYTTIMDLKMKYDY